jgi:hypothetical protein
MSVSVFTGSLIVRRLSLKVQSLRNVPSIPNKLTGVKILSCAKSFTRRLVTHHRISDSRTWQWPDSGSSNAAERPSRRLARQLALRRTWTRHVRAGNLRDNSQLDRANAVPQSAQRPRQHLTSSSSDFSPSV